MLSVAVSFGGGRKRWKGRGSKWKLIQWISRMVLENCTYGCWELRNQFLWNSPCSCTSKAHTCMPQFVDHWFTIFHLVIILLLCFTIFHRYIEIILHTSTFSPLVFDTPNSRSSYLILYNFFGNGIRILMLERGPISHFKDLMVEIQKG